MTDPGNFFNHGHGWICRRCDSESTTEENAEHSMPRYFREGEGEAGLLGLATRGLAKWTDGSRKTLVCPQCKITEAIDNT